MFVKRTSRRELAASLLISGLLFAQAVVLLHGHRAAARWEPRSEAASGVAADHSITATPTACHVCETASQGRFALRAKTPARVTTALRAADRIPLVSRPAAHPERDAQRPRAPPPLS
jgi:hypothetical protein